MDGPEQYVADATEGITRGVQHQICESHTIAELTKAVLKVPGESGGIVSTISPRAAVRTMSLGGGVFVMLRLRAPAAALAVTGPVTAATLMAISPAPVLAVTLPTVMGLIPIVPGPDLVLMSEVMPSTGIFLASVRKFTATWAGTCTTIDTCQSFSSGWPVWASATVSVSPSMEIRT